MSFKDPKAAGSKGGKAKVPKGFAKNPDLARTAGAKGKETQRRKKQAVKELPRKRKFFGMSLSRFKDEYEDLT